MVEGCVYIRSQDPGPRLTASFNKIFYAHLKVDYISISFMWEEKKNERRREC